MLNRTSKAKIIAAAKEVYLAYLGLELVAQPLSDQGSVSDQITLAIASGNAFHSIKINDQTITCHIKENKEDGYEITFENSTPFNESFKDLKSYTPQQKQTIIMARRWMAKKNPQTGNYVLSTSLTHEGKTVELGGPNKIKLYPAHIANLGIIIKQLESEGNRQNPHALLAALATGSGKSFTQALWVLVLHLSNVGGLFAAPNGLATQLHTDIHRLLPETVTAHLHKIDVDHPAELKEPHPLAVISYDALFSNPFLETIEKSFHPENSFLSFDEQHIVSTREDNAVKLKGLTQRYSSLFLTATPTKNSFKLTDNKTLLSLSRKQKEKQGYAIPAENIQVTAPTFKQKIKNAGHSWFQRRVDNLLSSFANAIVAEMISPIDELLRQSRYHFVARPSAPSQQPPSAESLRHFLRWNVAVPAGDKMLMITHDHDTLINLVRGLGAIEVVRKPGEVKRDDDTNYDDDDVAQCLYQEGNLLARTAVYDLFKIDNVENEVTKDFEQRQRDGFKQNLNAYAKRAGFNQQILAENKDIVDRMTQQRSMPQLAKMNVFCAIVNTALRVVTGDDLNTLDEMRFKNLPELCNTVKEKARQFKKSEKTLSDEFRDKEGLDQATADHLAYHVSKIITQMGMTSPETDKMKRLIDNWVFDAEKTMAEFYTRTPFEWKLGFTRFLFRDLEANYETKVENNVVYKTFKRTDQPLRGNNGEVNLDAKKRQHNAIEIFNDGALEYSYTPERVDNQTPEQVKAAFKLGLVPYMIGNTLVEGFNDPNLHVTVNIVSKTEDLSNQPAKTIQAAGRNRGLNEHRIPIYMQVYNHGAEPLLSLKSLDKDDYIPDFLSSTEKYNDKVLDSEGKRLAKKVKEWIYANLKADGSVDSEALKNYVFDLLIDSLLQLNKGNDHAIERSRRQLVEVLDAFKKELNTTGYKIRNTYQLSFFVRAVGNIIHFFSKWFYKSHQKQAYAALSEHKRQKAGDNYDVMNERQKRIALYHKIVGMDFSDIQRKALTFKTLGNMLLEQTHKIYTEVQQNNAILFSKKEFNDRIKTLIECAIKNAKNKWKNQVPLKTANNIPHEMQALLGMAMLGVQANAAEDAAFGQKCEALKTALLRRNDYYDLLIARQLGNNPNLLQDPERALDDDNIVQLIQALLLNDADTVNAFNAFDQLGQTSLMISFNELFTRETLSAAISSSLNISNCQQYNVLTDLVHHPLFLDVMGDIRKKFHFNELKLLLKSTKREQPEELKYALQTPDDQLDTRVNRIWTMLKDLERLRREEFDDKYIKFKGTMMKSRQTLEDAQSIFLMIFHSHLYFHRLTEKGEPMPGDQDPPLLIQGLGLGAFRVDTTAGNFFSQNAGKAFFLKAIKDSLPDINSLCAKVQNRQAACLDQVAADIITPMTSELQSGFKFFGKRAQGKHESVREFARKIKAATPLTPERAKTEPHCLVHLQQRIGGR